MAHGQAGPTSAAAAGRGAPAPTPVLGGWRRAAAGGGAGSRAPCPASVGGGGARVGAPAGAGVSMPAGLQRFLARHIKLGRIVALYHRPSSLYYTHWHTRYLCFCNDDATEP
jgi:hypothetical protein